MHLFHDGRLVRHPPLPVARVDGDHLVYDRIVDSERRVETVRLTIYGDFNCPFSALASARGVSLERRGLAWIDWRAVEHDAAIPPAGEPVTGPAREEFAKELAQIRGLLVAGEADRLRIPERTTNTKLAVSAFAGTGEALRPALREQLFDAYWTRGEDLNDAELLARLGAVHRDDHTVQRWRAEWLAFEKPIVPALVLPDGYVSRGLGALARLAEMAGGQAAS